MNISKVPTGLWVVRRNLIRMRCELDLKNLSPLTTEFWPVYPVVTIRSPVGIFAYHKDTTEVAFVSAHHFLPALLLVLLMPRLPTGCPKSDKSWLLLITGEYDW